MRKIRLKLRRARPGIGSIAGEAKRPRRPAGGDAAAYKVTLVARSSLELIAAPAETSVARAPRYDHERDEPAFQRAWQEVADAKARGEVSAVPPTPAGGIRLRGPRPKSAA